ncbi:MULTISPECIES: DUF6479 family protein [unclassified Streptomyces]|uniref:DUF6479 family protein n=1 Tax=unclassified Streptomyces TaxID=2593676 RepID=UPI00036AB320|nr:MULTISPECIES: DUF6479 family protein [unclassified Streptomyces]MYX29482.1 hypothetical protein [Streptomyces sp. SID8381]NED36497.1 hypothetical protein [Streptomyces sp. SID8499]NED71668.1 hypothetical protein [Streptomyces sp. SID9944]NMO33301.1 hypothetical protein [Streptomyces sp. GMY02]
MSTASLDIAAAQGTNVWPFAGIGLVVVALLIGAFFLGARIRRREPRPPRPEEQPRLPESGPVGEVLENREPDEVPTGGDRLTPHRLNAHGNLGSRTSPEQTRPRWDEGGSGSFGSGGPGGH